MTGDRLKISSARDVRDVLLGDDQVLRLALLKAATADPVRAAAYGPCDGADLIDWLAEIILSPGPERLRQPALTALAAQSDPRAVEALIVFLETAKDARLIVQAADRLGQDRSPRARDHLLHLVRSVPNRTLTRAAANALAEVKTLTEADALAVATWTDRGRSAPTLTGRTWSIYLDALAGPGRDRVRELIRSQGRTAFSIMVARQADLAINDRIWLLGWAAERDYRESRDIIDRSLTDPVESVRLAALQAVAALKIGRLFSLKINPLAYDSSPDVRREAIRAGAEIDAPEKAICMEPDDRVRLALIDRLTEDDGSGKGPEESIEALIRLLVDPAWPIRSAATAALIRLGPRVLPALEQLAEKASPEAALASARIKAAILSPR